MSKAEKILARGLGAGYAGDTKPAEITRGPFAMKRSTFPPASPEQYHDEWTAGRLGGGQEIAQDGDEKVTRLYAGGTIAPEKLALLGISEKDVTGYLIKKVGELGEKTRLHATCTPDPDGDWQYKYAIEETMTEIHLTVGMETITYQGKRVFAHGFLLSPVE